MKVPSNSCQTKDCEPFIIPHLPKCLSSTGAHEKAMSVLLVFAFYYLGLATVTEEPSALQEVCVLWEYMK